ncbi:MAG: hypothetical protein KGJ02_01780 [Verrucomicrobiota bacterium]|nr:hypothetical protein [Verrucomicrobiota bacterium]
MINTANRIENQDNIISNPPTRPVLMEEETKEKVSKVAKNLFLLGMFAGLILCFVVAPVWSCAGATAGMALVYTHLAVTGAWLGGTLIYSIHQIYKEKQKEMEQQRESRLETDLSSLQFVAHDD